MLERSTLTQSWSSNFQTIVNALFKVIVTLGLVLLLSGLSLWQPTLAQLPVSPNTDKADVVLDGRVLFRLGGIEGFTAQDRADFANDSLQWVLQAESSERPIRVRVVPSGELTTLRVNSRHLLTVTEGDFMVGLTSREQAEEWANILQVALQRAQLEWEPGYYRTLIWKLLLGSLGAIALYGFIRWKRRQLWRRWTHHSGRLSYQKQLFKTGLFCLEILVWLALLLYVCELFPQARTQRYQLFRFLGSVFNSELLTASGQAYSLLDIVRFILLTLGLWLVVRGVTATVKSQFLQVAIPERGVQDAIATIMQFSLTGLGLFILLQIWGIDLSALAILASVLGVGLGFGLQNIVNNFLSGWILLIERPVQVGDFINLGDLMGTVERVGARSTEIRTLDRVSIIVPNAELVQTKVVNWSHGHPVSRLHIPLGVAYGSPIEQVHVAVMEAAQAHPEVLRYPQPRLRFLGFGDSSLDFDLLVWLRDPRHQFDLKSDLYYLLEANLRRYQIEIPFPQRDLNVRNPELRSRLSAGGDRSPLGNPVIESVVDPAIDNAKAVESSSEEVVSDDVAHHPVMPLAPHNLLADVIHYSAILQTSKAVTEDEVEQLVGQMRGPEGLIITDRRFRLTVYPNCFVGSDAVTWIVKTQKATREAAVRLGQLLVDRGIFHHVTDEHPFKDENLFYRFYEDEETS